VLDGRVPHALLLELFTDAGVGTMVVSGPAGAADALAPARPRVVDATGTEPTSRTAEDHR
jgi:acetylglutamate kinase